MLSPAQDIVSMTIKDKGEPPLEPIAWEERLSKDSSTNSGPHEKVPVLMKNALASRTMSLLVIATGLFLPTTPASPQAGNDVQPAADQKRLWYDSAPKSTRFVEVEKGVKLEVLDWGGTGRPVVLLAGLGNTAHVFDSFAPKLTSKYHVYGITRRGYGASSVPPSGYDADRLGDDVLAVLSALGLSHPVLMGHSIAGEELSSIGTRHPDRVAGLVYLDAAYYYAYHSAASSDLKAAIDGLQGRLMPLAFVPPKASDTANFASLQAWTLVGQGILLPEAELHETFDSDQDGRITKPRTAEAIPTAILAGEQKYTHIQTPVLAICSIPHSYGRDFGKADPAGAAKYMADEEKILTEQAKDFESGNPSAHVVRLLHASHYVFLSNADDVVRETDMFISKLP
jgi:non-heme chloroperoxidase